MKNSKKVLSRVFSEDFSRNSKEILILLPLPGKKILDPRSQVVQQWNRIFLFSCFVSLFLDPLFFYLPVVRSDQCIEIRRNAEIILTVLRSVADVFYLIQIGVRFRTAYVAPSSRVFGRGELVIDLSKISSRYVANTFAVDLVAALPLPQVNRKPIQTTRTSLHSSVIYNFTILSASAVGNHPLHGRIDDDQHQEHSTPQYNHPVHTSLVYYRATLVRDRQEHWSHHQNGVGRRCV